jgi:hypothetical protein
MLRDGNVSTESGQVHLPMWLPYLTLPNSTIAFYTRCASPPLDSRGVSSNVWLPIR